MSPCSIASALDVSLCPHKHFTHALNRKESFDGTDAGYDSEKFHILLTYWRLDLDGSLNYSPVV